MDKTKKVIAVLIAIVLFYVFSFTFLKEYYGSLYTIVIGPLFWMLLAIYCRYFVFDNWRHIYEYRKFLLILLTTAALVYVIINFLLGIVVSGFANNPYDNSLNGILYNFWTIGMIMMAGEMVRSAVLNANTKFSKTTLDVIIAVLFTLIAINYMNLATSASDVFGLIKYIGVTFIPLAVLNVLMVSVVRHGGPAPAILYQLILYLQLWAAPILPDHQWIIISLLGSLVPFLTLLVFDNQIKLKEYGVSKKVLAEVNPRGWIIRFIIIVLVLLFFLGITPVYPINIITNSMYPIIEVGDVVIIKKCEISEIKEGDIIQYRKGEVTIVHRVVNISQKGDIIYLNTKGDNNKDEDSSLITYKNLLGKIVLIVPKVGLPNVWLKNGINRLTN